MAFDKDKILQYVRIHGPLLPTDLTKQFGGDTFIMGAILSELLKSKHILVSNVKIGGSPLYLTEQQRSKLIQYSDHLNEKDREAYELLRQKKLLYDKEQTPLLRVSLRQIKDFARPITVSINNTEELFWRWFMTPLSEVEQQIRNRFMPKQQKKEQPKVQETQKKHEPKTQQLESSKEQQKNEQKKAETLKEQSPSQPQQSKKEEKKESETKKDDSSRPKIDIKEQPQKILPIDSDIEDDFHNKIKKYFVDKKMSIKSINIIRKNQEIEYVVELPTTIGSLDYYCRAKAKKKINETDLASAFVGAQKKKLPILFLTQGTLTKKAQESLSIDFPGMKILTI